MSFLKKLFGGGGPSEPAAPKPGPAIEYKGFTIRAEPFEARGQHQLAGVVLKSIDGVEKSHRFVRADTFDSRETAIEFAHRKGRQLVDEQGDKLFG
jgi:hypothetical protein